MSGSGRVVNRSGWTTVCGVVCRVVLLFGLVPGVAAAQAIDVAALDRYFAKAGRDWQVPGFAVAIVKDDSVAFMAGYGVRELGTTEPVDEHTLFAIASNTKAFTAAALARLVDEGRIAWDDRVTDHLPYLQLYSPYVTAELRVRDLLCHRSGLGTYSGDLLWYGTSYTREGVLRRARHLDPAGAFRADYGYSNLMFLAAGEILPAVTGRSWDEYIEAEFFGPLGMVRSVTSVDSLSHRANVATPHGEKNGRLRTFPWYGWDNVGPAASIISSVSEMAQWLRLQLHGGTLHGRTYFSEEAARTMWTPHMSFTVSKAAEERFPSTHFRGYGLGWGLMDYRGRLVVSHGGAYDGMYSRVVLVPEERLGLVVLTNSMTSLPTALAYRVLDVYLGGAERDWSAVYLQDAERDRQQWAARWEAWDQARMLNTSPSLPIERYAGTYGGPLYGDAVVGVDDGRLVLRFLPNPDLTGDLAHWHHDTFQITWRHEFPWFGRGWVQFAIDRTGTVVGMKVDVPNEDFWFTELEFTRRP